VRDGGNGVGAICNRPARPLTILLIMLLVGALGGCSQQTQTGSAGTTHTVTIRNQSGHDPYGFVPKTLTVAAGTRVVWRNRSSQPHTVTSSGGHPSFSSGVRTLIKPGHSWSFTFKKPGRYPYYCIVHPFMKGAIVVQAGKSA
jgi:plastocyanin